MLRHTHTHTHTHTPCTLITSPTSTIRDKDGDGKLNRNELKEWIMPEGYDHAKAEATHLIYESDVDSVC